MMIMDTFEREPLTQAKVVITLFSRIWDLHNMDVILRAMGAAGQKEVLLRLGCLNVLNPLKPALDYSVHMKHRDCRVLLMFLLETGPSEAGPQVKEDPRTELSVVTLYGALHRIANYAGDETLLFNYGDVGERTTNVSWNFRRDALKKFLIGTSPMDKVVFRVISMYRELEHAGSFTRGPIEQQYLLYLKRKNAIPKRKNLIPTNL